MSCQKCGSNRILSFSAKCSDMFNCSIGQKEHDGYVPEDVGLGGRYGDYVSGDLCMNCGQLQGTWPLPQSELEASEPEKTEECEDVDDREWVIYNPELRRYYVGYSAWSVVGDVRNAQVFSNKDKLRWETDGVLRTLESGSLFKEWEE